MYYVNAYLFLYFYVFFTIFQLTIHAFLASASDFYDFFQTHKKNDSLIDVASKCILNFPAFHRFALVWPHLSVLSSSVTKDVVFISYTVSINVQSRQYP